MTNFRSNRWFPETIWNACKKGELIELVVGYSIVGEKEDSKIRVELNTSLQQTNNTSTSLDFSTSTIDTNSQWYREITSASSWFDSHKTYVYYYCYLKKGTSGECVCVYVFSFNFGVCKKVFLLMFMFKSHLYTFLCYPFKKEIKWKKKKKLTNKILRPIEPKFILLFHYG